MEQLVLKIEKNHINRYGWEDSEICNCILNVGSDLEGRTVESNGEVKRELKRLAKDGFIPKRNVKKYGYSINRFDQDMGNKIDLNRIVKLAKSLHIQVNIYEIDESGNRHVNPDLIIKPNLSSD